MPPIRTREEALTDPTTGDLWQKGRELREVSGFFTNEGRKVHIRVITLTPKLKERWPTPGQFRRWCAGAEYLGGGE